MATKRTEPEWEGIPPEDQGESYGPQDAEEQEESYQARTVSLSEGTVDFGQPTAYPVSPGTTVSGTEIPMLDPTRAADVMTEEVKTATPDTDLHTIAALMRDENVGIVPIVEDGGILVGVITDRDIVVRVDATSAAGGPVTAREVMTTELVTVGPQDDLLDVIDRMGDEGLQRMLVASDRRELLGIISVGDLARRTDLPERVQDVLDQISRHRS
jgi:CBS domain-containing protein